MTSSSSMSLSPFCQQVPYINKKIILPKLNQSQSCTKQIIENQSQHINYKLTTKYDSNNNHYA